MIFTVVFLWYALFVWTMFHARKKAVKEWETLEYNNSES
jgi:hypothetical protein